MLGGAEIKKFKYKKKFGQNFLIDDNILNKIKDISKVQKDDLIIEIGAGSGNLTKKLQEFDSNLICYEIDEDIKPTLEKLENKKTKIIFDDFLKRDIKKDIKDIKYKNLYIIANLPYYITTPIINKIIEEDIKIKEIVIMVQKEVADRFTASPGTRAYGSITVYLNYYFDIEKCFVVGQNSFYPKPKIDSTVIKFTNKKVKPKVLDEKVLFQLIRDSFKFKRKTLRNNLKGYNFHQISKVLFHNNLRDDIRAENIPLDVFIEIANTIVVK